MADAIVRRVDVGRPLLAICLGLQLLCESSEESPGVAGLGIIDADVRRFPVGVRAPHFGWNRVEADPSCSLLESGYACYAHSYRVVGAPAGWSASMTTHGAPFVAAMVRGPLCACQFHPELSGEWGQKLLERWLACEGVGSSC
jgi:imidazole glycerol phosphate synthase glutamine amidotransferase subunit